VLSCIIDFNLAWWKTAKENIDQRISNSDFRYTAASIINDGPR
jgi:hypothetical protein